MNKLLRRMSSKQCVRLAVNVRKWKPTETEWTLAAQCVQQEEKERIGKFVFQRDAKASMVGRLLIRRVVSNLTGVPYGDIQLGRTDKGKPILLDNCAVQGLSFNVAHHGDYAVIAADTERSVGIDIMQVELRKDMSKFFTTLQRQLTGQEWSTVNRQCSDRDKMAMFYRFWCLKEAYVKALGTGIGFEVGRLDFHITTPTLSPKETVNYTSVHVDGKQQFDWSFEETMLDGDHCVAVASLLSEKAVKDNKTPFKFLTVQELLSQCQPLPGSAPDRDYWQTFNARKETPRARET